MSLIQEALQRQQSEMAEAAKTKQAPAGIQPPLDGAPPPQRRRTGWQILILILLLIAIAVTAFHLIPGAADRLMAFIIPGRARQPEQPATEETATVETAPAVSSEMPAVNPPWLSAAAVAAPAFADEDEDDQAPALPQAAPEPEPPVELEPAAEPEPEPEAVAAQPAVPAWPRLTLSAIFSHAGSGRAMARINGQLIRQGGQVEGVTLEEIGRDSVVLSLDSERRSLKVGSTLF